MQPSHPLTPSSPSALNLSQHQGLFQWVVCSHQMTKILELQLQHQSFQGIFRVDLPYDWLVWSPCYPRDFQESSLALQLKASVIWHFTFFMVQLSQWYGTTRKTIDLTIQTFVSRLMFLLFNTQPSLAWSKNVSIYSVSGPTSCPEGHMKLFLLSSDMSGPWRSQTETISCYWWSLVNNDTSAQTWGRVKEWGKGFFFIDLPLHAASCHYHVPNTTLSN